MKKRFFSLLLVLILAASALNITAFAYSEVRSGYYNGSNWVAHLNRNGTIVSSQFTISANGTIGTVTSAKLKSSRNSYSTWFEISRAGENSVSCYKNYYDSYYKYKVLDSKLTYSFKTLSGSFNA